MEKKFVKEREEVEGTMELYAMALRDNFLKKMSGKIKDQRTGIKNVFIQYMSKYGAETINFGKLGNVNWSERKGAKNRTFNNRTRENPSKEKIDQEYKKLDHH